MNMFKSNDATSIQGYIARLPHERKSIIEYLHSHIQKVAPDLKPHFAYNMLGYGSFKYRDYKKQEKEWPIIALANQKNYVSLYICATDNGKYIPEQYGDRLGKVSIGKSCIRFKKLEDLNLDVLDEAIKQASASKNFL